MTIAEKLTDLVKTTEASVMITYRRQLGVVVEVCDVCGLPVDSEACREHCKK